MIIALAAIAGISATIALHAWIECWTLDKKYRLLEQDMIDLKTRYLKIQQELNQHKRAPD